MSIESQTCSEACNPSRQARRAECSENLQNNLEFYFPNVFNLNTYLANISLHMTHCGVFAHAQYLDMLLFLRNISLHMTHCDRKGRHLEVFIGVSHIKSFIFNYLQPL